VYSSTGVGLCLGKVAIQAQARHRAWDLQGVVEAHMQEGSGQRRGRAWSKGAGGVVDACGGAMPAARCCVMPHSLHGDGHWWRRWC